VSSFKGSYSYSVDNKGRINIPAKLRKYVLPEADSTFVITRGYDQCLYVYPLDEWAQVERDAGQLSSADAKNRFYQRKLMENATESRLDAQFRIVIPKDLLQFAGIENDVLIIGVLDHIEIWNPRTYKTYIEAQAETFESVAQTILKK
jgi:MraZ protein